MHHIDSDHLDTLVQAARLLRVLVGLALEVRRALRASKAADTKGRESS